MSVRPRYEYLRAIRNPEPNANVKKIMDELEELETNYALLKKQWADEVDQIESNRKRLQEEIRCALASVGSSAFAEYTQYVEERAISNYRRNYGL